MVKTELQDNGLLKWTDKEYTGELWNYRRLCELNAVFYHNNTALLYLFPVDCFKAFRQVYILTYMFDAQVQRYYYDFYGAKFRYIGVDGDGIDNYHFTDSVVKPDNNKFVGLITIEDSVTLNAIGEDKYSLSVSWYDKNIKTYATGIKNGLYNFFMNKSKNSFGTKIFGRYSKITKSNFKERATQNHFFRATPERPTLTPIEQPWHICVTSFSIPFLKISSKVKV